jgi:hypothetical protein
MGLLFGHYFDSLMHMPARASSVGPLSTSPLVPNAPITTGKCKGASLKNHGRKKLFENKE